MKSGSGSPQQANPDWRLRKTLAREVDFRAIEQTDVRYAWAAYKKGALGDLGDKFKDMSMSADEFKVAFEVEVTTVFHGGWILIAPTKRGIMPVGLVLAFWSHSDPRFAPFMNIGHILWFPWASARNKIESIVNFFSVIRHEVKMMQYANLTNKRLFEVIARHGVMRRVGTSYNVFTDGPAAVFETRSI